MNAARKCLLLASASLVLGACATTDAARMSSKSTISNDVAYIVAVEKAAKEAGVGVVWVNPPQERKDD
ncbi:MAG TPA: hypothetical protein VFY00_07820 [Arenimonas sp.]|nr:hypothetical protein [Arenimonas sp.]